MKRPGEQLRMFMSAGELKDYAQPGDLVQGETPEEMWEDKEAEARLPQRSRNWEGVLKPNRGGGIYNSIKREAKKTGLSGVTSHVWLAHGYESGAPTIFEGHHRTAAALAHERETGHDVWVPLSHTQFTPNVEWEKENPEVLYPQTARPKWKGYS